MCSIHTIIKIVKKLKPNPSLGPDMLTPYFLKNVITNIASPLCKLYNICLEDGYVPTDWKTVHDIIPLIKRVILSYPATIDLSVSHPCL